MGWTPPPHTWRYGPPPLQRSRPEPDPADLPGQLPANPAQMLPVPARHTAWDICGTANFLYKQVAIFSRYLQPMGTEEETTCVRDSACS